MLRDTLPLCQSDPAAKIAPLAIRAWRDAGGARVLGSRGRIEVRFDRQPGTTSLSRQHGSCHDPGSVWRANLPAVRRASLRHGRSLVHSAAWLLAERAACAARGASQAQSKEG